NQALRTSPLSTAHKKMVLCSLFSNLYKCGPGVLNPIADAYLLLHVDHASRFQFLRKELAAQAALLAIREHALPTLESMPGSEIHWVNYLLDQYCQELGIPPSLDSHAVNHHAHPDIQETFETT